MKEELRNLGDSRLSVVYVWGSFCALWWILISAGRRASTLRLLWCLSLSFGLRKRPREWFHVNAKFQRTIRKPFKVHEHDLHTRLLGDGFKYLYVFFLFLHLGLQFTCGFCRGHQRHCDVARVGLSLGTLEVGRGLGSQGFANEVELPANHGFQVKSRGDDDDDDDDGDDGDGDADADGDGDGDDDGCVAESHRQKESHGVTGVLPGGICLWAFRPVGLSRSRVLRAWETGFEKMREEGIQWPWPWPHRLNVALRNWTWHYLDLVIVLFGVIEQWMLPLYHVIYASIVGHASSATLRLWLKKLGALGWQFQDLRTGTMSLACFYLEDYSVALSIYIYIFTEHL